MIEAEDKIYISKSDLYDLLTEKAEQPEEICFIFGAGASCGYTNNTQTRYLPPIVANLFDEQNPAVWQTINSSKHSFILGHKNYLIETLESFDNDLERYLSFLYNKDDDDETFSALLVYIQDLCELASGEIDTFQNNYKDLINRMTTLRGKSPWSCISFNYDTILEKSFIAAGRDRSRVFSHPDDYFEKNPKVIKIHGSTNYRFQVKDYVRRARLSERNVFSLMMKGDEFPGSEVVVHSVNNGVSDFYSERDEWNPEKKNRVAYNFYDYPLMMIPVHNTQKTHHPLFTDMLEKAKERINKSSLIVAIGYNFGDELLFKKLQDLDLSNKHLVLVGTESLYLDPKNHVGYKNAVSNWKGAKTSIFKGNAFNEFVRAIMKKLPS